MSLLPPGANLYEVGSFKIGPFFTTLTAEFFNHPDNWFVYCVEDYAIVFRLRKVYDLNAGVLQESTVVPIRNFFGGHGFLSFFYAQVCDCKIMRRRRSNGVIEIFENMCGNFAVDFKDMEKMENVILSETERLCYCCYE